MDDIVIPYKIANAWYKAKDGSVNHWRRQSARWALFEAIEQQVKKQKEVKKCQKNTQT